MICNSCGKEFDGSFEICDKCIEYASNGTQAICVICDKISLTCMDVTKTDNKMPRMVYTENCLACSGKFPKTVYEKKEDALKKYGK